MKYHSEISSFRIIMLIAGVAVVAFFPFLGGVHLFDWDEINFAESAREMLTSGDYLTVQIGFKPFWEKPPFFIWMQALSMKIFGVNEFAARFPNAVCSIVTLFSIFILGKRIHNTRFATIWVIAFMASILPFFYFRSGIIDPWFNLFIFLGISFFVLYLQEYDFRIVKLIFSAVFLGLAVLTKGPAAIVIFMLVFTVYLLLHHQKMSVRWHEPLLFALVLAIIGGAWFILQVASGRSDLIIDFLQYQVRLFTTEDAGHGGFMLYHFIVLLIGVFPASIFAVIGHKASLPPFRIQQTFRLWMLILLWVVLILFSIVSTKIVHYSSLAYFPVTYLAAVAFSNILDEKWRLSKWAQWLLVIVGAMISLLALMLPVIGKFRLRIIASGIIEDPFANANLSADVFWNAWVGLPGVILVVALVAFVLLVRRQKLQLALITLFASSFLFINLAIYLLPKRIEGHSQRAAIEFFKSVSHKDAYLATLGYKSYAPWFYGNVQPVNAQPHVNSDWLLHGDIDKPAYFSTKNFKKSRFLLEQPELQVLYEKNGFVFLVRYPHAR